nr:MAG TPA: hypothetical protein [Caudoviricetes sp.]
MPRWPAALRTASGINKDSPGLVSRPKGCGGSIPPEGTRPRVGRVVQRTR